MELCNCLFLLVITLNWIREGRGSGIKCYSCESTPQAPDPSCQSESQSDEQLTDVSTPTPIDGPHEYCVQESSSKTFTDESKERELSYKRYKRSISRQHYGPSDCAVVSTVIHRGDDFRKFTKLYDCAGEKCNGGALGDPDPPGASTTPDPPVVRPTSGPRPRPSSSAHHPYYVSQYQALPFALSLILIAKAPIFLLLASKD